MITKSEYLFALACIPSRTLIALWAKDNQPVWLIALALAVAAGFFRLWLNPSIRAKGLETFGQPIWWNQMRVVHAALWLGFALAAIQGKPWAWRLLALDAVVGLASIFFIKY